MLSSIIYFAIVKNGACFKLAWLLRKNGLVLTFNSDWKQNSVVMFTGCFSL